MKGKKISILILLLTLALSACFGLIGCGGGNGDGEGNKVNVTFDLSYAPTSGAQTKTVQLDAEEDSSTLNGLGVSSARLGYEFLGYFDSQVGGVQIFDKSGNQAFQITADITLYAQWQIINYQKSFASTSTFADVSEIDPISVKFGESIITLPTPEMTKGYEFIGWATGDLDNGGVLISNGGSVKSDYRKISESNSSVWLNNSTLTAVVEICKYTVSLIDYNNRDNNQELTYEHGSKIIDLPILEHDEENKLEFVGWSTDYYTYKPYTNEPSCLSVEEDVVLYAFYYQYRIVEFYKDSSNDFVPVKIYNRTDVAFEMPDIPNPGRELVGWYVSRLFNTAPLTTLSYNSGINKVYGKWNVITYTTTFDLNGGSVVDGGDLGVNDGATEINSINYNVESEISLPILYKERFTFKGWYRSDDATKTPIYDIELGSYGNVTLVAKFEGDKRKVIYHANEGSLGVTHKFVEYYADYTLDIPTSELFGFFGWYLDENFETQLTDSNGVGVTSPKWTSYDEETHVYAKFLEKRYILLTSSHLDAGTVELKEHYVEGEIVLVTVEPKEQYTVEGIMINGVKVTSNSSYEFTMPADDVMLHVLYEPKTYNVTLEVSQNLEYCSKTTVSVKYGELYTLPVAFKEGYKFVGWEYSTNGRADILTNSDGTSKEVFAFTTNLTVKPFYIVDKNNKDIIIKSEADFLKIKDAPSATYQLVANLNLMSRKWTPFDFSGTLNGNGYSISNLSVNTDEGNVALFNNLTGKVDGLTLINVNMVSTNYNGVGVSSICYSLNGGSITNCVIESGVIKGEVGYAGGFASRVTSGTITNCVNKANVETDTTHTSDIYAVGGIAGFVDAGTITNCANYGAIKGAEFVGGIIGRSKDGSSLTINYLENHGSVTGSDSFVGGIIGRYDKDYDYSVTNLSNSGTIKGVNYVAGLIGYWEDAYNVRDNNARKVIANAFENSGTIMGEGSYVGGLLGKAYFEAPYYDYSYSNKYNGTLAIVMKESKNTGDITGGLYVGGLIGHAYSDTSVSQLENPINNSKVTAKARVGAIAGDLTTINLISPSNLGSTITATETSIESGTKYAFLGGYVGRADNCNISSATNSCNINYSATSCEGMYVGGIAGWSTGTFTDCRNTATIYAPKSNYVGGIAGQLSKLHGYSIKNVGNSGAITGNSYVAGIFGEWRNVYNVTDNSARVVNAIGFDNSGVITGSGSYVGGLMGNAHFEAPYYDYSYSNKYDGTLAIIMRAPKNTGDITGNLYVGGLIGKVVTDTSTSMIEEGVSSANITATAIVGGIAGNTSTIKLIETSNRNSSVTALGTYDDGSAKYAYVGGYIGIASDTFIQSAVNDVEIDYSQTLCVGNYVGGFTGWSTGYFEDCTNNAVIYAPKSSHVGGISGRVGKNYGYTVKNVKNTANITGTSYVAGIFGEWYDVYYTTDNNARVVNAIGFENSGNIKGNGSYVGGLLGNAHFEAPYYDYSYSNKYNGTLAIVMKESKNTGNVEGNYYVGGIAGRTITDSDESNFIEVTSKASVKATALVGGMFGEANGIKMTATSNDGTTVTATGTYDESTNKYAYVGGYIGKAYNVTIDGSVNDVEINYSGELCIGNYVGGFTGYSQGIFTNVINNARVYAPNSNYVGGISGSLIRTHEYTIENDKNYGAIYGKNYVSGLFGEWQNVHYTTDNGVRKVNANSLENHGSVTATGNFVGGLAGYAKFEAPYYDYSYSNKYNGQQLIYMRDAVNTGNVQGETNVGGLMGYLYTDSGASQIFTCTQTGVVTGANKTGTLLGEYANVILPEIEE